MNTEKIMLEENNNKNLRSEENNKELEKCLSSTGLSGDAINMVMVISLRFRNVKKLSPIETYEEYIHRSTIVPGKAEKLIEISNQDSIKKLNQLIAKYNTDLPRIKEEDDQQAVIDFYNKADELIRGNKATKISFDEY